MKKHWSTALLILLFLLGLSLLLYPSFSNWWNSLHQSRAIADYEDRLANMEPADYAPLFEAAEAYNRTMAEVAFPLMHHDQVPGYGELLNISGSGVMGYVTIPKIDVELPICHGTSEAVLQTAVGHLEGSSLPTGGDGTHCVLSAHRGLPSAKLFTDLDRMEVGDTFTLTVLDRILTYEVDRILIVEPQEVEALYAAEGEDLCTLVTCTPYGINTHRLLVRGRRVENREEVRTVRVTADAVQIEPVVVAPIAACFLLLALLIVLLIPKRGKRRKGT